MATIKDVAREAGCSPATVSRALSGSSVVSQATRSRIERVARRLEYEPNAIARSLRQNGSKSRLVGLIVPSVEEHNYSIGTSLLHDALANEGYQLLLSCHHNNPQLDDRAIRMLIDRGVDAIVHVPSSHQSAELRSRASNRIAILEWQRYSEVLDVDAVVTDAELGSYSLTQHLIGLGHEQIAIVAGYDLQTSSSSRVRGFSRAIAEAHLAAEDCPTYLRSYDTEWGRRAAAEILARDSVPTAVICGSVQLSLGVLAEFQSRGIEIPKAMSLVGLSDAEWCAVSQPPLTTYEFPLREMGLMAAQLLLNRLKPQLSVDLSPRVVRFAGRLIERGSEAPPNR